MRIVICGGPKVGKTTFGLHLSGLLNLPLISTDAYREEQWEDIPDLVIHRLQSMEDFILEGVQAARVLRRWFKNHAPPIDEVYFLTRAWVRRSDRQESMAKGVWTVWRDVLPLLERADVLVSTNIPPEFMPWSIEPTHGEREPS